MTDIPASTGTGASIALGGTVTGTLETAGDHDWYAITLSAGQSITISLTGVGTDPVDDTYLILRDSAGNQLAFNDDGGSGLNSQLSFTATTSGTYYIDAGAWSDPSQGYYGDTGTYQLSVATYVPPPVYDYDQIADQLVNGFWEEQGASARHFNVSQGGTITVNLTELTSSERNLARHALELWSDAIGINFAETSASAQINFHHDDGDTTDDAAFSTSVTSGSYIVSSEVNIDSGWVSSYGTSLNSYSFQTYLHEIGHALGLGHAGNYNGTAEYSSDALYQNDAWTTTVMSYFSQQQNSYFSARGFTYDYAVTPMLGDLVAMSLLYGSPTTTRTGDTVYGFHNTSGREVFDASTYPNVAYTIIDSGGIDTLDYSGFGTNQRINLNSQTFSDVGSGVGNVSIARGTVIENAIGGSGNDVLTGNSANNVLTGNGGNDTLNGGGGFDTASYATARSAVTVNLGSTAAQNTGGAGTDTLASIENLLGSAYNDTLTGNASANLLEGGLGNDRLNGGAGVDTASYVNATSRVVIDLALTGAQNTAAQGFDTLTAIESVDGSQFSDVIRGNGAANHLDGGDGNDILYGRSGNDTLVGGDGNDRFYGSAGNDVMSGGNGTDTAYYTDSTAGIRLNLAVTSAQNTGGAGSDTLSGIEFVTGSRYVDSISGNDENNVISGFFGDDVLHGGAGGDRLSGDQDNDSLYGDAGGDRLLGRIGDDSLYGGDDNDRLYGEAGNDLLDGGAGNDIAYYTTASAGVTVNLGIAGAQETGEGLDTLVRIERVIASRYGDTLTGSINTDFLYGGDGNDQINGAGGRDTLLGQNGDDTINGGDGIDRLFGGSGNDNFRFDTALDAQSNWDYIYDFSVADDTLQLSQSVFGALSAGALSSSAFQIGTSANDAGDRIIYDQATGRIYYDADGNGAGAKVLFARVDPGVALTAADFSVVATSQAAETGKGQLIQTPLSDMPALDPVKTTAVVESAPGGEAGDKSLVALFADGGAEDHFTFPASSSGDQPTVHDVPDVQPTLEPAVAHGHVGALGMLPEERMAAMLAEFHDHLPEHAPITPPAFADHLFI